MTNSQFDINVTNSIIILFIDDNRKQSFQTQSFQNFSNDNIIDYATKLIEIQKINVKFEIKRQYKIKQTKFKFFREFIIEEKLKSFNEIISQFRLAFKKRSKKMITKNEKNFDNDQSTLKKKSYQLRFNVVKNYFEKNFKKFRE